MTVYMKVKRKILVDGDDPSRTDLWFAWYPVRTGAFGDGKWMWWRKVWRNRSYWMGLEATIYADPLEHPKNVVALEAHNKEKADGPAHSE